MINLTWIQFKVVASTKAAVACSVVDIEAENERVPGLYELTYGQFVTHVPIHNSVLGYDANVLSDCVTNYIPYCNTKAMANVGLDLSGFLTVEKAIPIAPVMPEGSDTFLISHNFCDKTTWYTESVAVEEETLETIDYLTYTSPNDYAHWIDLTHGRMPYEDRVAANYTVSVWVDDVLKTEDTDFEIDYDTGSVVFPTSQEGKTVVASYHYATTSAWIITPATGKILKVRRTELNLMGIAYANITASFQIYVGGAPYGPPIIYKGIRDFLVCSVGTSNLFSAAAITNQPHDMLKLPFDYVRGKVLKNSLAMSIKITVADNIEVSGDFAYITASCDVLTE